MIAGSPLSLSVHIMHLQCFHSSGLETFRSGLSRSSVLANTDDGEGNGFLARKAVVRLEEMEITACNIERRGENLGGPLSRIGSIKDIDGCFGAEAVALGKKFIVQPLYLTRYIMSSMFFHLLSCLGP
jgi:hypothetical protein